MNATQWAWEQDLPLTPKFVLVALGDYAGSKDNHTCWPSYEAIARKIGATVRAVRYNIKDLLASGFIRVIGFTKWGTPLYQLAVGEVLKWKGRLRGAKKAKEAPAASEQGSLFVARRSQNPVNQVPPNIPLVPEPSFEEREDARSAPVDEHIREGDLVFTVAEHHELKQRWGEQFPALLEAMNRYHRKKPIANPYLAALAWRLAPPQPTPIIQPTKEETVYARPERESSAQGKLRRTKENSRRVIEEMFGRPGGDVPERADDRGIEVLVRCADGRFAREGSESNHVLADREALAVLSECP